MKKVLCFFNDFFIGLKRNIIFNLFLLVLIGISLFGGTKVKAYYSFNRNQSVSFTTATYTALSLTTDRNTYGMCNRDATVKLTINNPNIYNVNYTISINDSKLTYTVDGSSSSSYTITKNGTKTHTIVLKGTTTNTSVSIIVTPTGAYSSSHSKSINLDLVCPVCTWETPSISKLMKDQTFTYNLTCTDASGIATSTLASTAFTVSNSNMISITGVTATKVTNGYKYGLTVKGGSTNGNATISVKAGSVADNNGNKSASVTSSNINVNNNVTVNFDHNYNILNENTSKWTFHGQSKVDSSNQYNGRTGVAVYSNAYQYTGIKIPILSTNYHQNVTYLLSGRFKKGANFTGTLKYYTPAYDSSNTVVNWNVIGITASNLSSTWKLFQLKISSSTYSIPSLLLLYDTANQGPTYISDIKLREYATDTKQYKTAYGTLPTSTRVGYTFSGWYTGETDGTKVADTTTITNTNEHTLYGHWNANTYTINYYTYDGKTKLGSSTHTYDSAKALTTMATLKGTAPNGKVTFYGWATSANSTSRVYTDGQSVTNLTATNGGTINLYAIYRSAGVTITYKSGLKAATTSTSSTLYYYNGATSVSITTGAPAAISNWTAQGWRADTTAGAKTYSSNTATNFSASTTLYGVYTRSYTATFYSGVEKATTKTVQSSTSYYNSSQSALPTTVNVAVPSKADTAIISNWDGLGYRTDTNAQAQAYAFGETKAVAFGTNFYAVYSNKLTVSYNGNGSTSGSTAATTKTVYLNTNSKTTSSQTVTLANNGFTRTGYTYSKWAAGSANGTQYAAGASYTPNVAYNAVPFGITMYAVWTANQYTITYDQNYYSDNLWTDANNINRYYGTGLTSKTNVSESLAIGGEAMKFVMSATTSGGPYFANTAALTAGTTYTWEVYVKSNVNKNLSIGSEQGGRKTFSITTSWQRLTYTFTAEDKQYIAFGFFGNWSDGDELYVHSLQIRAGNQPTTSSKLTYGTTLGDTVKTLSRTGYTFAGWYTSPVGGSAVTSASIVPAADTTYYAHWTANAYTIGYTLNGGTKGTNGPTSGIFDSILTIDNPTKTFTVNITNSASGTLSATNVSKAQTFAGWTATNSTTGTALYGTSNTAVKTAWSDGATKVTAKYFRSLRSTSGTVTLTANWKAVAVTLPTVTKTGYTCGYTATSGGTTITYASGASYTPSTTIANVTLYTVCVDNIAPSPSISTTSNLKAASQTATLKCTDGVGVTSYYWGTNASPAASDYTTITSTTSMSVNKTVSAAGKYYLICKDAAGNASSSTNKTYRSYTVNNMLLNVKGSKGTYTTANYTSASTKTYIIPNSTVITLRSIYTAPTGGTYVGTSSGAASNDSATLLTSNPTITANATYTAWFNRNEYTITVATGGNGSVKVTSENNTTGVTATASGSNKTLTARYGEKISATATPNSGFKFSSWSSGFSGSTNPASLTVSASVTIKASFADNSAPTCSFGSFSPASIMNDSTATITLTCTDNIGVVTNVLTSSSFTVSNSNMISIEGVTATKVTNGYKYSLTVKGGSTNGNATISIKAGMVADNSGNTNASVTSPNININNNVTVNFDHNYNIYDENTSNWTFQGQSKVDSSNQYNGKPGFAVYSNAYQYTGIIIPILSTKVKQNTSYLLSAQGKLGATISGNLRLYAPTFNSDGTKISSNYGINWNTSNTTTSAWKYFGYKFNLGASDYFSNIGLNYDVVNQGPIYISDLKLREYTTDTKQYKTAYGTLPTPTRTGYRFDGWYTSETGGTVVNNTTIVSNSNAHTLYARWSDVEAPTCSFGSFTPNTITNGTTATITLTCTDNVGVATNTLTSSSFTISNTNAISISNITSSAVSGGYQYVLTVTGGTSNATSSITLKAGSVKDATGNSNAAVTSSSITNIADQVGPEITFSPNGNMAYSKSQTSKVTVTDESGVASAKYIWTQTSGASASSGTAFTSGSSITKNNGDGLWYICVYATDNYGNATNKCSEAFALDNTAPVITASDICILKGQTLVISNYASASDANGVTLTASAVDTSTTGVKSVTITAKDSAGNTSTKTVNVTVYTKLTEALVTSGDGLYKDSYTANRYLYRGATPNNYLTFNGETWRIVAVNPDGTYKLVYTTSLGNRQFHYQNSTFAGSRLETYLLDTYYAGLTSEAKNYIVSSEYYYNGSFDAANYNDTMATNVGKDRAQAYTGKVALLSASDYILASTHTKCTNYYYAYTSVSGVIPCSSQNYLSALNKVSWWVLNTRTSSGNQRYFNTSGSLESMQALNDLGVYPTVTLKGTTTFLGSGTASDPYTICTNCEESGLSSTTCEVTTTDGYDTSKVITITPSSTSGIQYSWDGITWSTSASKTITEAGVYSGWIKDSSNKVNRCSLTINSRKEYRSATCDTVYGSWSLSGQICRSSSASQTGETIKYEKCRAEFRNPAIRTDFEYLCNKYTRTCTPSNCSAYGAWQTDALYGSCNQKVESRTAIGK